MQFKCKTRGFQSVSFKFLIEKLNNNKFRLIKEDNFRVSNISKTEVVACQSFSTHINYRPLRYPSL